jgi:1,4-dihydroxy-2-naphthoyl-CoA hydrolase
MDTTPSTTSWIRDAMPLCATLGVEADEATPGSVVLSLDWAPELCTSDGLLHGGVLMALADSAGGACAFLNLPEGAVGTSTIESGTHFVGRVTEGRVTATARPLHVGKTTIVIETEVRSSNGRLVAKVSQTQAVLRPAG